MNNTTNSDIPATYDERKIQPFLSRMEDYKIGIVRWKVPSWNIPMFKWEAHKYFVSLVAQGDNYDQEVNAPNNTNNVFTYDEFVEQVNISLRLAFAALVLGHAEYDGETKAPEIVYNAETKLFSIVIKIMIAGHASIWTPTNTPNPITLYFSDSLFSLFRSFVSPAVNPTGYRAISILDTINNRYPNGYFLRDDDDPLGGYVVTRGSYPCLYAWQKLTRIIIMTTLPIQTEDIGSSNRLGAPIEQSILTDFEVEKSQQNLREPIYYFANNNKRFVNFTSNGPLKEMNLQIFWEDDDLGYNQLMIPPGGECYIKLQFVKKSP